MTPPTLPRQPEPIELERLVARCTLLDLATLGFDPSLPLAEVDRRIATVRSAIAEEVAGADISILARA